MAGIESIQFRILDNAEHLGLVRIILPALETVPPEECQASSWFHQDITSSHREFDAAMGRVRKSELTEEKGVDDEIRDENIDFAQDSVSLYLGKKKGVFYDAAVLLQSTMKKAFADINFNNNTQQSEAIVRLENEYNNSAEIQDAAKQLRINSELETAFEANRNWIAKDKEQATIKENDNSPRIASSRIALRRDIRAFVDFYEHRIRRGSELHQSVADKINGPIRDLMAKAKARESLAAE